MKVYRLLTYDGSPEDIKRIFEHNAIKENAKFGAVTVSEDFLTEEYGNDVEISYNDGYLTRELALNDTST